MDEATTVEVDFVAIQVERELTKTAVGVRCSCRVGFEHDDLLFHQDLLVTCDVWQLDLLREADAVRVLPVQEVNRDAMHDGVAGEVRDACGAAGDSGRILRDDDIDFARRDHSFGNRETPRGIQPTDGVDRDLAKHDRFAEAIEEPTPETDVVHFVAMTFRCGRSGKRQYDKRSVSTAPAFRVNVGHYDSLRSASNNCPSQRETEWVDLAADRANDGSSLDMESLRSGRAGGERRSTGVVTPKPS
ncbi:MAG TPA: hypothetical protein VGN57_23205 [Pirellulaceae bacterium]|nr:hypothetical protein [Pirellulaceae bacterium]